ncbi:MAG TPA: sensor histidine kinase N-terminal domain-containing protein, partial [Sphingomicrobium sp.]|nr:sensor histidine kinase N-terminal domain-containing protein [Sphingomicrobium sp.]
MNDTAATKAAANVRERRGGSLTRRMIVVAAVWIGLLLLGGGYALDRVLSRTIVANFDDQLERVLNGMIGASEIDPDGEVRFSRPPADQRFLEPYSGAYFQISGEGHETFPSRSLWDRRLRVDRSHNDVEPHSYDSGEFEAEPLRVVERDVVLPGSERRWRFQV